MESIESLALFPLPDVVLLPEVSVPLRLFEPRYLQMAQDVLAGSNQIGMVAVRPDRLGDMAGDPTLFEVGCLGQVSEAEQQRDGTIEILLVGLSRFRILNEEQRSAGRLYRSARVELLEDAPPDSDQERDALERLRTDLFGLLERVVGRGGQADMLRDAMPVFGRLEPAHLINALTQSIGLIPIERQQLLEADSILGRFEIMCDLLRFRLAEIGATEMSGTGLPN